MDYIALTDVYWNRPLVPPVNAIRTLILGECTWDYMEKAQAEAVRTRSPIGRFAG